MFNDEQVVDFSASRTFSRVRKSSTAVRENAPLKTIMRRLKAMGLEPIKNHGSIYSKRARPDIEVLVRFPGVTYAVLFAIEVKRPGGAPTPQQVARLESYRRQGAVALVADNWPTVARAIEACEMQLRGGE